MPDADPSVLDNPAAHALAGPDARFAIRNGAAARYRTDVSPFAATPAADDDAAWRDLAALVPAGDAVGLADPVLPAGWSALGVYRVLQLVDVSVEAAADGVVPLGDADVPEMRELVDLARPGPFAERTIELGGYVGIRVDGRLVAMAGERVHPAGWAEVSAVCTHPDHRGRGYAARAVRAVVGGVRERGDRAFLHVEAGNGGALRLYEALGFVVRREGEIVVAAPGEITVPAPH
ncbi:GNAT family N-acetyltransferase [Cellulomonas alba]|uniref:GNAT family N-acetyltransferase n=1 Tax=Cellulomonas alba TaxID=3053467 RepID=A0ABT7SGF6_9CELL|nr:GNAT family N-acetyltransferase [Cellulomonas alba]MDM7855226.1 GNAT family N-acetyltransferase [Cellulomonas alba]